MEQLLKKQESYLKLIVDNTGDSVKVQKEDSSVSLASIDKNIADLHMTVYEQLDAVINGLKEVNDSIIQTFATLDDAQISLNKGINRLIEINDNKSSSSAIPSTSRENEVEGVRREESSLKEQAKQTEVLEDIRDNTAKRDKDEKKESSSLSLPKLGFILTGLAVSLGAIAGLVKGYVKILTSMGRGLLKAADFVLDIAKGFGKKILKFIDTFLDAFPDLKKALKSVGTVIFETIDDVKKAFNRFIAKIPKIIDTIDELVSTQLSRFGKFVSDIPFRVMSFIDDMLLKIPKGIPNPLGFFSDVKKAFGVLEGSSKFVSDAVKYFTSVVDKVKGFFNLIKSYLDDFAKIFKAVIPIFEKLALPLTVIMAVWDTVKGAIEGFEKEGIVGAIKGAITGLFNSLIGGVLDLIKSAISWVAGALGFDAVEKALDSFSFQDLTKKVVDGVFNFIGSIGTWVSNLFKNFSASDMLASLLSTVPNMIKSAVSWVAGLFGFDKVKEKLDAINITDIFKGAIDSVINLVSSIGDWISEKISSVKNFLGFGKSEEQAQKELDRAKRRRENFSGAARVGAVGYDANGNIMTSTMMSNGVFNREAARDNILSQGGREMTEEEAAKYEANLEEEVKRREEEFKKISEAPTLGKLFKEMVLEPLVGLFNKLKSIFNEFVVQPIEGMVSDIEGIAQEYIIDPVKSLFDKITGMIDKYIAQPLDKFFSPLVDFFKKIPEQLKGIFEYVGIPEFKYTIPLIGKEISIGPFYPFRPGKDETKVNADTNVSSSTSYEPEGRTSSKTVTRSASTVTDERSAVIQRERTSTSTADVTGKTTGSESSSKRISAAFDTKTGTSSLTVDKDTAEQLKAAGLQVDERGRAQISNRAFRLLKNSSDEKKDISSSVEILKEDADYQKLTRWDQWKVDVGYAKASDLLKDPKYKELSKPTVSPLPGLSQNVYDKSVRNDQMKMDANAQQAPVVVNAATTNVANNRQNIVAPVPLRNQDSALNRYMDRRAVVF
jgi:hypothetical protein